MRYVNSGTQLRLIPSMETRDRRRPPQPQQRPQQSRLALLDRSRLEINEDTRHPSGPSASTSKQDGARRTRTKRRGINLRPRDSPGRALRQKARSLTRDQAFEVYRRHASGETNAALAREFEFPPPRMWKILNGQTYRDWYEEHHG